MLQNRRAKFFQDVVANGEQRVDQFSAAVWFDVTHGGKPHVAIADLLLDLENAGMPRQHRTRFTGLISKSSLLIKGPMRGTVRLNPSRLSAYEDKYGPLIGGRIIRVTAEYLPMSQVPVSRRYLARLAEQLNGCFECEFFDAAAVMARRLVEVLLIEAYIVNGRAAEIQSGGAFLMLDKLIARFAGDAGFVKSRNIIATLDDVKSVGDTAAHSRVHIASRQDLDDLKLKFRRAVSELVALSGFTLAF